MDRPSIGDTKSSDENRGLPLPLVFTWMPFPLNAPAGNDQFYEGLATMLGEWQNFLGRRFKEDLLLAQRLAASATPDQVWTAYAHFWQRAAEHYGSECVTLSQLMGSLTRAPVKSSAATKDEASHASASKMAA